jgi:two-component system response regulator VanR
MKINILLVEDDKNIREMVGKFLVREGYTVNQCADGEVALDLLYSNKYHLIILDILLPNINGQELLLEIRKISDVPVLMMTALSDEDNQIRAFKSEADDYVTKPFSMNIFLKRVEALLRRSGVLKKEIRVGELILLPESQSIISGEDKIQLPPREFEILQLLSQHKGRIVPHETMLTTIWGWNFSGNEGIVLASMKKPRDKLAKGTKALLTDRNLPDGHKHPKKLKA